ncbi:MAG: hypothetical protein PSX71_03505 [bacterium]|nr:hypothetical protein [bacterium]
MSLLHDADSFQINFGQEQRIAAGDYNEINITTSSLAVALALLPPDTVRELTLTKPDVFRHRFHFDAPRLARAALLELQDEYDLSDREIRRLRDGGQLKIDRESVSFTKDRLPPLIGWGQIHALSILSLVLVLQIAFSVAPAWKQMIGQIVMASIWVGGLWIIHGSFIAPWELLRKVGLVQGVVMPTTRGWMPRR